MPVFSFYVEKKSAFAGEAAAVLADLRSVQGVDGVTGLRLINRYFAEGLAEDDLCSVKDIIYDPAVDIFFDALPDFSGAHVFASELLPAQYDQNADTIAQCIALATGKERPLIKCGRIYVLDGDISNGEFDAVKSWLINSAESRESPLDVPHTLAGNYGTPDDIAVLEGFIKLDEAGLIPELDRLGLAMDLADLAFCQAYFRDREKRDPTITEIRMIDTYWSDHCRHTTFFTELDDIEIADESIRDSYNRYLNLRVELGREDKPLTLMDMATIGAKVLKSRGLLSTLDESEEVNACSVKIEADVDGSPQDWLLMFKNETHNHPTEIEPFGGAATCLGGAIRDPLSGRSYVYQAMRITGAGDPRETVSETLPGKLPQVKICRTAAAGYSSYGNQIGSATGHVHEIYHPGYTAKRMELGAVIAAAPAANVMRERPVPGDVVILLGGKTGRDGCGGATGSSKTQMADSMGDGGPKGNPPEERKIVRLFRNPEATRLIKRCNDFGAGGVSVAVGELADGLDIDLDKVPVKYGGLDGTEIAISESQERMAVVVAEGDAEKFIGLASEENLDAVVIASVVAEPRLTMTWRGKTIVSLARSFLNSNGAAKHASAFIPAPVSDNTGYPGLDGEGFMKLMAGLSVCSQKGLIERFDYSAGAASMLAPLGGAYQLTPSQAMAARLPVPGGNTSTCSLMSWGFDPFVSTGSPYHGAMNAVVHSVAKIIAAGGSRGKCWLTFQEYFERLRDEPARWGKPAAALLGALDAQMGLSCAAIGGKDSMSGSFEDIDVPPALVSFAVSVTEADSIISTEFKRAGGKVYFLRPGPGVNPDLESLSGFFDKVEKLISDGKISSAWAVGSGGPAEAVVKMGLGNRIGFAAVKPLTAEPMFGGFILEAGDLPGYEDYLIGTTTEEYTLTLSDGQTVDMAALQTAWEQTLEAVYPTKTEQSGNTELLSHAVKSPAISNRRTSSPKFVIPVFPGTNSEYDVENAILRAGGETQTVIIRNRNENDIAQSIRALEQAISSAQGVVLPGGDVSGTFIVSLLGNSAVCAAMAELLQKRDGLVFGAGAGFRALVKLGLITHGEIREQDNPPMTITLNRIGRHQSVMAEVRVASNKSPWLSGYDVGYRAVIPVSGEFGRFVADEDIIRALAANGQIATQYMDPHGNPSMDVRFNPGGSNFAIEGITSPDGRVFGRVGHGERGGNGLFVNIPGNKNMDVFEGAVRYFKG